MLLPLLADQHRVEPGLVVVVPALGQVPTNTLYNLISPLRCRGKGQWCTTASDNPAVIWAQCRTNDLPLVTPGVRSPVWVGRQPAMVRCGQCIDLAGPLVHLTLVGVDTDGFNVLPLDLVRPRVQGEDLIICSDLVMVLPTSTGQGLCFRVNTPPEPVFELEPDHAGHIVRVVLSYSGKQFPVT